MRRKLFAGWVIPLMLLLGLYSCSTEMDNIQENKSGEVDDLRIGQGYRLTRSEPWDEEEESPLKWAEYWEGTGRFSPCGVCEFEIFEGLGSMSEDEYEYYVYFSWGAGFGASDVTWDVPKQYYMQIQWSYTDDYYAVWSYINMPNSKYGLVKVFDDSTLEKIPAFAFPYNVTKDCIYLRMRTVHEDFIGATPVPDVEGQYKYDRSLYSNWSYPVSIGDPYRNEWGYGKPQPSIDDIENGNQDDADEASFIVWVYLPVNTDKYEYSCTIYNHSSGYTQYLGGTMSNDNVSKAVGTNISKNGGQIEVIAKRTNKLDADLDYETVFRSYSRGEKNVDIYISQYAFGYE